MFYLIALSEVGNLMKEVISNTVSASTCKNHGYNILNENDHPLQFTSDNYPSDYDNKVYCYWSVYAPDSLGMTVTLPSFEVIA